MLVEHCLNGCVEGQIQVSGPRRPWAATAGESVQTRSGDNPKREQKVAVGRVSSDSPYLLSQAAITTGSPEPSVALTTEQEEKGRDGCSIPGASAAAFWAPTFGADSL